MSDKYKHIKPNLPKNYFGDFENRLKLGLTDLDHFEIESEAPTLHNLGKDTGFKTPDFYFENFKVDYKEEKPTKVLPLKRLMLAAASLLIAAAVMFVFSKNTTEQSILAEAELENIELSDEEILTTLNEDDFIDDDILIETYDDFEAQLEFVDIDELVEANIDEFDLNELENLF